MLRSRLAAVYALTALAVSVPVLSAAEGARNGKSAADLLPASTIAYAELTQPAELLKVVLDHPLRARVEQLDQYKEFYDSPQYMQLQFVRNLIENQLDMKWRDALATLTKGGITAAFDPQTEGVALFIQSDSEQTLAKLMETLLMLAREDAKGKGKEDPIKSGTYRDIKVYAAGEAKFARLGKQLVIVNKKELGEAILNSHLDGRKDSLAANAQFQSAKKLVGGQPSAWIFFDISRIREQGALKALEKEKSDNPGVELLLGGLISTLRKTPYLVGTLNVETNGVALSFASPHDAKWVGEEREFYFGPNGKGVAPPLLEPKDSIFALSTYRNFSLMWLNSANLFTDAIDDGFAQANAGLSTLFSGKDFGEDVLGAVKPEVQFVATKQKFSDDRPIPSIKLPAFAFVFRFKEPDKMRKEFKRIYQSLIGFLNVVGAMNGQPPLDLDMDKMEKYELVSATVSPEDDEKNSKKARINFNFSPSVAFAGDRFVVSSTEALARELGDLVSDEKPAVRREGAVAPNMQMESRFAPIRDALAENRKQLVAQNILKEGHTREEAENQIDILLELVGLLKNARFDLGTTSNSVKIGVELNLAE